MNERMARGSSAPCAFANQDFDNGALGPLAPMPGILDGFDLGVGGLAREILEDVVSRLAVEPRIEKDVDAIAEAAQHVETVAIVKRVVIPSYYILPRPVGRVERAGEVGEAPCLPAPASPSYAYGAGPSLSP